MQALQWTRHHTACPPLMNALPANLATHAGALIGSGRRVIEVETRALQAASLLRQLLPREARAAVFGSAPRTPPADNGRHT